MPYINLTVWRNYYSNDVALVKAQENYQIVLTILAMYRIDNVFRDKCFFVQLCYNVQ